MIDGEDVVPKALEMGMCPESFFYHRNITLWKTITRVWETEKAVDEFRIADWLQKNGGLEAIGGYGEISSIVGRVDTAAMWRRYAESVYEKWLLRKVIKVGSTIIDSAFSHGDPGEIIDTQMQELRRITESTYSSVPTSKSLMDFEYPDPAGPDCLLGNNRFLGRGGTMLLVSAAGVGKSSMSIQMGSMWALGKAFMGIPAVRKTRVLVIQSEDDDGDIGELAEAVRQGIIKGDPGDMEIIRANLHIIRDKKHTGDEFLRMIPAYARRFRPDIIIINPIYAFIEGDASKPEVAAHFLTGLNKANPDDKWAYLLVHHTAKPSQGENKPSAEWEDAYRGFGSSFFANFPRATALLQPRNKPGEFFLKLGKRAKRAGVVGKTKDPSTGAMTYKTITKIPVRHTQKRLDGLDAPMILWEASEYDPEDKEDKNLKVTRKQENPDDFLPIFPRGAENAIGFPLAYKKACSLKHCPKASFNRILEDLTEKNKIRKTEKGYYLA